MKYNSRFVMAMRSYFKELEKHPTRGMSINGEFPAAHEKKIRIILKHAKKMIESNETGVIK